MTTLFSFSLTIPQKAIFRAIITSYKIDLFIILKILPKSQLVYCEENSSTT